MEDKSKRIMLWAAAGAGVLAGLLLTYYGFELVSVPTVEEYREGMYVLAGLVIAAGGIALGVMGMGLGSES